MDDAVAERSDALHLGLDHVTVVAHLGTREKHVEMWLPHNESMDLIALRTDAPVRPRSESEKVWLHHGSSISQGSNAGAPTEIWPVVAARTAGDSTSPAASSCSMMLMGHNM